MAVVLGPARCVDDVKRKRGLCEIGAAILMEENVYASRADAALDFAVKPNLDVMAQRAVRNHEDNVSLNVSCARDGGVQCGGGSGCRNFVVDVDELHLKLDVKSMGLVFGGWVGRREEEGPDELGPGTTLIYGGVYGLSCGLTGRGDSDHRVVLNGAHKVDGKLIGVDASVYGGLMSRIDTDASDRTKNALELGHLYIQGNRVVAVVRVRPDKVVKIGDKMLCEYMGEGNDDSYGSVGNHELFRVGRLNGDPPGWQALLNCVHHVGRQKQMSFVCKDCGWMPVCKACFAGHRHSPAPPAHRAHFKELQSWKKIFAVAGVEGGVVMDRLKVSRL